MEDVEKGGISDSADVFATLSQQFLGRRVWLEDGRQSIVPSMSGYNAKLEVIPNGLRLLVNLDAMICDNRYENLFTMCHELGHIALGHCDFSDGRWELYNNSRAFHSQVEQEADDWALEVIWNQVGESDVNSWLWGKKEPNVIQPPPRPELPSHPQMAVVDEEVIKDFLEGVKTKYPRRRNYGSLAAHNKAEEAMRLGIGEALRLYLIALMPTKCNEETTLASALLRWRY